MKSLTAILPTAHTAPRSTRVRAGDVMITTVGVIVTLAGFFRSEITWFLASA